MTRQWQKTPLAIAIIAASTSANVWAQNSAQSASEQANPGVLEEMVVVSQRTAYANNQLTDTMKLQYSDITNVMDMVDDLPGVSIQQGDAFGFDDWTTSVSVRGFQTNLGEQQVGSTIDGLPNGNSNYGGGSKANRYIDTANIGNVQVFQGTADIASRSLEALGGTINFVTDDPTEEERIRAQYVTGQYDAARYFIRYDSGVIGGNTRLWVSASHQEATDWVEGSAENERDHLAGKLISDFGDMRFTAYVSYDDTHEDNYQRVYSEADYESFPEWDQLTGVWTDIPYVNQSYRRGWSTLRENLFAYGKLDWDVSENFSFNTAVYLHQQEGRGDWIPPYLANVTNDNGGPESELGGSTVLGGSVGGLIHFVDGNGMALSPTPGCVSSLTFPYGGGGAEYDPACYQSGAVPVQSYRHTHYERQRVGFTADARWDLGINTLRAGLWYEDGTREEYRDWHKLSDARIGIDFDNTPYWVQYSREYPQDVTKWYIEDEIAFGGVTVNLGVKQFLVEISRDDVFGESTDLTVDSDSDVLFSGGVVWATPVDGLEVFGGYAENFKSFSDNLLERPDADLDRIDPETSDNLEVGLRYTGDQLFLTATYFDSTFDNRIIFLAPGSGVGNDYLIGTNGTYFNAGGIDSSGFELAANYNLSETLSVYGAYTYLDATYSGSGDAAVDAEAGIFAGNDVTGIPDSMFVLSVDYTGENMMAGLSAKMTGDRAVNTANTWTADSYTMVDAYVMIQGSALSDALAGMTLDAQIKNLTDTDYLGVINSNAAWIGAPRTVTVGVNFEF
jgi:outer membrane receptor protein involved in Fe transport